MDVVAQQQQKKMMIYGTISTLLLLVLIMSVGRKLIYSLLGTTTINGLFIAIAEMLYWLSLLFVWVYSNKIEKQHLLLWQEKQYGFWMHIKSLLVIFGLIFIIALPILAILIHFHLVQESTRAIQLRTILQANRPLLLFACLTAGVTEEFIFRGYLMPRFEVFFKNPHIAIILTSVLFGLMHLGYGTISQVVGPTIIGLVLGYYYWRYRNIAIPIIAHFLWDYMSFSLTIKPH